MTIHDLISDAFSQDIGIINETEQEKILSAKVSLIGAGGVGGLHILTLARLRGGKFQITDPDIFEAANVSRQFGVSQKTFGRNKADVPGEMVKGINSLVTRYKS